MHQEDGFLIRRAANDLLQQLWNQRDHYWKVPPSSRSAMLPVDPFKIALMLGLSIEEREEIIEAVDSATGSPLANTAGIVDHPSKRIVISQKFDPRVRRFTLAHEIGHYVLHPQMRYHRDRSFHNPTRRSIVEYEADRFGVELLMPDSLIREEFLRRYEGPCGGNVPNEELAYWLSAGSGKLIDPCVLANDTPKERATLVAQGTWFRGRHFESLHRKFDVSLTAMALRLLEMRFVL